jgi:KipI family sensor histidine kinase inhibitor
MTEDLRIRPAGDAALLVELPARIDREISARAVALEQAVRRRCGASVRDVVVGFCSVTVYFDPLHMDAAWLESEIRGLAASRGARLPAAEDADGEGNRTRGARFRADEEAHGERNRSRGGRLQPEEDADWESGVRSLDPPVTHETILNIPVCYGSDYGPDLADVAAYAGATTDDVIALHCGTTYRVYVVGFVPGFPYMASVDPRLAIPRRATPRTRVPAGSVAIAAGQTGIYPGDTPGGWHLIGRTHVKPYDPSRAEPFLFKPGDSVRFHPIGRDEFERGA